MATSHCILFQNICSFSWKLTAVPADIKEELSNVLSQKVNNTGNLTSHQTTQQKCLVKFLPLEELAWLTHYCGRQGQSELWTISHRLPCSWNNSAGKYFSFSLQSWTDLPSAPAVSPYRAAAGKWNCKCWGRNRGGVLEVLEVLHSTAQQLPPVWVSDLRWASETPGRWWRQIWSDFPCILSSPLHF